MYASPKTIVEFEVRVPLSVWGRTMDDRDKARQIVEKYTYSDSAVVDVSLVEQVSIDEPLWVVTLRFASHQPAATAVGVTLNSQFERYLSGGLRPTLGPVYTQTKEY